MNVAIQIAFNSNKNVHLKVSRDPKYYLKSAKNYKPAMQQSVFFTVTSLICQQLQHTNVFAAMKKYRNVK